MTVVGLARAFAVAAGMALLCGTSSPAQATGTLSGRNSETEIGQGMADGSYMRVIRRR